MIAVAYTRFSVDEGGPSCESQLGDIRIWAAENGHTIAAEYSDDGWSGTIPHRPDIDRLIAEAPGLGAQIVAVRDWYRIGRGRPFARIMSYLEDDLGLSVVSLTGLDDDPMMADIRGVCIGGEFVRHTRKVVTLHFLNKAKHSEFTGGNGLFGYRWVDPNPPEAYDRRRRGEKVKLLPLTERVIVPEEAAIVRRVFELFDPEGPCMRRIDIARELGLHRERILRMIRHPSYAGAYTYGRAAVIPGRKLAFRKKPREEWVVNWGAHPGIVSRELWERCNERIDRAAGARRRNKGSTELALTGLLRCGVCGNPLRVSGCMVSRRGGDRKRYYYRCRTPECSGVGPLATEGWTEDLIRNVLSQLLRDQWIDALLEELHHARSAGRIEGASQAERRRLEASRDRIVEAIASGDVGDTTALRRKLDEIQKALESHRSRETADRRKSGPPVSPHALRARLSRLLQGLATVQTLPEIEKAARPLLHQLVQEIRVNPASDRASVTLSIVGISGKNIEALGCTKLAFRLPTETRSSPTTTCRVFR